MLSVRTAAEPELTLRFEKRHKSWTCKLAELSPARLQLPLVAALN